MYHTAALNRKITYLHGSYSLFPSCETYHTLREAYVVAWGLGRRLVRSSSISKYTQLLNTPVTTLSESAQLNPVRSGYIIGMYHKIVALT